MDNVTVVQAFEVAIAAERAAEKLFQGLEAKFAHYAEVATFWKQYALDETKHAEWLEGLKARLTPEQLSRPVDAHTVELLQAVTGFSVEKALLGVKNLEDAYQLVNEVENGETNAIFQFLLNNFEADTQMREFLRAQLDKHIARLSIDLPTQYKGILARQAIQTLE
ncbi:MAG: ferritin family protein [Anaerolineales bacterium]